MSESISRTIFPDNSPRNRGRRIREWARHYLETETLPGLHRGRYQRLNSLLQDEDLKKQAIAALRSMNDRDRTPSKFAHWIKEHLLKEIQTKQGWPSEWQEKTSVSLHTARKWMTGLGFSRVEKKKGLYFDGHERDDVVKSRTIYLDRMNSLQTKMEKFDDGPLKMMECITSPTLLANEVKHVLVVHDESTFAANDDRPFVWCEKGREPFKRKQRGKCIMVSAFLCECHGLLKIPDNSPALIGLNGYPFRDSTSIIEPGGDNWWTAEDMIEQVNSKAVPIFNALHPGCVGVFQFDNSSNHGAFSHDALRRENTRARQGGVASKMRDTVWFDSNNEPHVQSFNYPSDCTQTLTVTREKKRTILNLAGLCKGSKVILEERGIN